MVKIKENIYELAVVNLKNLKFNEFQTISEHVDVAVMIRLGIITKTNMLSLTVTPPNGDVIVDGIDHGLTPLSISLNPGSHTIDLGT